MNSSVYFEAYRADGSQILGNLDGQYVHCGPMYQRTRHYRRLKNGNDRPLWARVHHWKVTVNDRVLETIENKWRNEL